MDASYSALLGLADARRMLAALAAAWLSFGMVSLAILLSVVRASHSYAAGGAAVAAFAIGAAALAPVRGRLVDRRGGRRVLPALASGYAIGLVALAILAILHAPAWALDIAAAGAGLSAPPLVAASRGAWVGVVDRSSLRRAYALTALIGDVGLVVAPALAAVIAIWSAPSALVVCAVTAVVASVLLAPLVRPPANSVGVRARSWLIADRRLRAVVCVSVALGAALGLVEVGVPGAASEWHATWLSGLLLGAFAAGSVLGSVWLGRREPTRTPEERYLLAVAALALALAPSLAASSPAMLAPFLFLAGTAYGPATISLFETLDVLTPRGATEALTWVTTAEAAGTAGGAALAGLSLPLGTWVPFALATTVLSVSVVGTWRRVTRRTASDLRA